MFFTPFRLLPRVNHWLQRHFPSRIGAVTGGTNIYDVTYCPPLPSQLEGSNRPVLRVLATASGGVLWIRILREENTIKKQ